MILSAFNVISLKHLGFLESTECGPFKTHHCQRLQFGESYNLILSFLALLALVAPKRPLLYSVRAREAATGSLKGNEHSSPS